MTTDPRHIYYELRDEHINAGHAIPQNVRDLAAQGEWAEAIISLRRHDLLVARHMADLTEQVLERHAVKVRNASAEELAHLAERAEALPDSRVCAEMRALIDAERDRRLRPAVAMHIHQARCQRGCTGGVQPRDRSAADGALLLYGWNEVTARTERWAAAGYVGDWRDAEYDSPSPVRGDR